jgi:urea transport system substrate-binding protein
MEATYTGFRMWAQAVTQARTTAVDAVRTAMYGQKVAAPSRHTEQMWENHHLSKPVMIGEIQEDGQFSIVHKTADAIRAENWSPFIPENANRAKAG